LSSTSSSSCYNQSESYAFKTSTIPFLPLLSSVDNDESISHLLSAFGFIVCFVIANFLAHSITLHVLLQNFGAVIQRGVFFLQRITISKIRYF